MSTSTIPRRPMPAAPAPVEPQSRLIPLTKPTLLTKPTGPMVYTVQKGADAIPTFRK